MRHREAPKTRRSMLALLLAVAYAAVGAPANAVDIKIATVAPDGSRWMQQMRAGAEEVAARTQGRVAIKFYPGGVMGNDAQVLRKIRIGQLQGGAFTAGGLAERYGGLNLYGIPLMFRSLDEIDVVRAEFDAEIAAGLERAGFVSFGFIEGGMTGTGVILISMLMAAGVQGPALIATDAVISTIMSLAKALLFGSAARLDASLAVTGALVGLCTAPGAFAARAILARMPQQLHLRIMEAVVVLGGLGFLWRAWR